MFPSLNRYELAQTISEHLGWFTASGGYKTDACVKLLERLEAKGCIKLRAKRASPVRKRPRIVFTTRTDPKPEQINRQGKELSSVCGELEKILSGTL